MNNDEPPGWLDNPDLEDWELTPEEITSAREDRQELEAKAVLDEVGWLQGRTIPLNGQTPTRALAHEVSDARTHRLHKHGYGNLDDLLNEPDPEYNWLIPNLIERHDRIILTGQEGKGKTTLLRQIAVQTASGIHPFTLTPITPIRVTLIDLENSRDHDRRQFRPLRTAAGDQLLPGYCAPIIWPAGIDLLQNADRKIVTDLLDHTGTDLLIIGPTYKLASGDPTSEETARHITRYLDELRNHYGFALILEAHQPYATPGSRRVERPYGASLWSRWPEFGLHLGDDGALRHWRGARDERDWPAALQRGGEWPWTVVTNLRQATFSHILDETRAAGYKLSVRELASRLGANASTISRAISANRAQYDYVIEELDEEAP